MLLVSKPVLRLLGGGSVISEAIGFHDQPQIGPVEVDPESVDPASRYGQRQPRRLDDGQEAPLQLRVREDERAAIEDRPQSCDPPLAGIAR
jgi:hypothetical protein